MDEERPDGFDLHPTKRRFVELYVSGTTEEPELAGNATRCYGKVYPHLNLSDSTSREYGNAAVQASAWLRDPEVDRYRKALVEKATKKVRGKIAQAADRAATVLLGVMDGGIRSRLQLDAAVKVLELNGITPIQRTELDIGERMDSLIKELASKRRSPFRRTEVGAEVPAMIGSGQEGGTDDGRVPE